MSRVAPTTCDQPSQVWGEGNRTTTVQRYVPLFLVHATVALEPTFDPRTSITSRCQRPVCWPQSSRAVLPHWSGSYREWNLSAVIA
jgi:hypothetical protein